MRRGERKENVKSQFKCVVLEKYILSAVQNTECQLPPLSSCSSVVRVGLRLVLDGFPDLADVGAHEGKVPGAPPLGASKEFAMRK